MKQLRTLYLAAVCLAAAPTVISATYSTEAMTSLQKDEGTLQVDVRVARLLEENGKLVEQLVAAPRIRTAPGVPATLHTGPQPNELDSASQENVTVEVSWPYPNESGVGLCAVIIKRGNEVVSKSRYEAEQAAGLLRSFLSTRHSNPSGDPPVADAKDPRWQRKAVCSK